MREDQSAVVDFIARGTDPEEWIMVLVEQGPWTGSVEEQLRRIQNRLYGCIDAALDGQLAGKFPETLGKKIVVQLDCYDLPESEVSEFFHRFSKGVLKTTHYRSALNSSTFVKDVAFKIYFDTVK